MRFIPARVLAGVFFVAFIFLFAIGSIALAQEFIPDAEVTAAGKSAVRAREFLDWTLNPSNTNWQFLNPTNDINQLAEFWGIVRGIANVLTLLVILATAFIVIITRGKKINVRKQLIGVGIILLLINLSFTLVGFIYQISDTLQNSFLDLDGNPTAEDYITTEDLLFIGFDYNTFEGYRAEGAQYDEAANISLFFVKITSVTYYVMAGLLLIRKIILWFFIILSPLWVLLLPFPLIRNTAKIWVGEFFRWLLYGILFAVLLRGLVGLWQAGIPLKFDVVPSQPASYPTAINILLGGPGDTVARDTGNLSNINQYANYAVALLMLWIVIILPFVLLKIFRDALGAIFKEDNAFMQKALASIYPFFGKFGPSPRPPPTPTSTPPPPRSGEGLARDMLIPKPTGLARDITIQAQTANIEALPQARTSDIIKFAGLGIPNIRDIAKMEMSRNNIMQRQAMLKNLAAPTGISNLSERSRYSSIQQELLSRSKKGDVMASTILAAAQTARTGQPVGVSFGRSESSTVTTISGGRTTLSEKEKTSTPIVVTGGRTTLGKQGAPITAAKPTVLPTVNRVQTVGIEDYEDVKKMWEENYRSGEIPISEKVKSREEWVKQDVSKIENVIELLASMDEEKKKQGLTELAVILPFLLLGGFSDQETIVYLKAKLEGAKKILTELEQKVDDEEKVLVENKKEGEAEKHMEAEAEEKPKETEQPTAPENKQDEGPKLAQTNQSTNDSSLKAKIEGKS